MKINLQETVMRPVWYRNAALFTAFLVLAACASREPALSAAARYLKKEIRETISRLSPFVSGPLAKNDAQAVQAALEKAAADAGKAGTPLPFKIFILDKNGIKVAGTTVETIMDFSSYEKVRQILDKQKAVIGELYLKDTKYFFIGTPVLHEGKLVGILVFGITEDDLKKKCNVSEQEFLALDLNL
ncbi:MAG: hypothetical protein NTZ51_08525 [Proteobacteria bacterium]|nr:hypothetical protein [Pseudomonadota bacterium]